MALNGIFSGGHGTISLAAVGSPVQQADFGAINTAYGGSIFNPVGRVEDVEICVQTELQEYYELGSRDVRQLVPGNIHVSGKIRRGYMNGSLLFLLLNRRATGRASSIQPHFTMNLLLKNPDNPTDEIRVNVLSVKLENWGLHVPQTTFVMEHVTFKAAAVTVEDTDDSNAITVAFADG